MFLLANIGILPGYQTNVNRFFVGRRQIHACVRSDKSSPKASSLKLLAAELALRMVDLSSAHAIDNNVAIPVRSALKKDFNRYL